MFLETVKSEGLAHLSYIVGEGGQAAVIDPRLDVDVYLDIARRRGARIRTIVETHRNEDYLSGARLLGELCDATVLHGEGLEWAYGELVADGDTIDVGQVRLRILDTPGHTLESISIAVVDTETGDQPIAVFTGDALFVGDVGRTDFYPERAELVAGLLWDSIHHKLLPLGDQALVLPAHGAGSVCGSGIASRDFSTIGYERRFNPMLQLDRDAFVARKLRERHVMPPYFQRMHRTNRVGEDRYGLPAAQPLSVDDFAARRDAGMVVLDVRAPEAICGAFIDRAIGIPLEMLPSFAGWYLPYLRDIGLVVDGPEQVEPAVRHLHRLGYHQVAGWLGGGMVGWCSRGQPYRRFATVPAHELKERLEDGVRGTLLDVRTPESFEQGHLPGARNVYVGELGRRIEDVPPGPVLTYCTTGKRSTVAATILARHGFDDVEVALGSMSGCLRVGCPTEG